MLRKRRLLIKGLLLTMAVVILCLFIPGILLQIESSGDVGHVILGRQGYYADNVDDDSLQFDFAKRLRMVSGKWKSQRTSVEPFAGILDQENAERIGQYLCYLLEEGVECDYFGAWEEYAWIHTYGDPAADPAEVQPGNDTEMQYAVWNEGSYIIVNELENNMQAELYRYSDKVLNSFDFYVWEVTCQSQVAGTDFTLLIDAVTLDLYSIELKGDFWESENWYDTWAMWLTTGSRTLGFNVEWPVADWFYENELLQIPVALHGTYYEYLDYLKTEAPSAWDAAMAFDSGDGGYRFENGNFACCISRTLHLYDLFVYEYTYEGGSVYEYLDFTSGISVKYTDDPEEIRERRQ